MVGWRHSVTAASRDSHVAVEKSHAAANAMAVTAAANVARDAYSPTGRVGAAAESAAAIGWDLMSRLLQQRGSGRWVLRQPLPHWRAPPWPGQRVGSRWGARGVSTMPQRRSRSCQLRSDERVKDQPAWVRRRRKGPESHLRSVQRLPVNFREDTQARERT